MENRRKRGLNRQLDSWKEIASYFGRDERTVKRWEKHRGLPVHRLPGARGGVYAFTDELVLWMSDRDRSVAQPREPAAIHDQLSKREFLKTTESVAVAVESATEQETAHSAAASLSDKLVLRALIAALVVVLAGVSISFVVQKRVLATLGRPKSADTRVAVHQHVPVAEAQELYLKGRYFWNKRTPADLTKALNYFQQAVACDPAYALAYVGLADSYNLLREYAAMPEDEAYRKAIAAARKAIELDATLADAHNSLAFDLFFGTLDRTGAEREFQTAIKLNPNCELAHHWYATFLMSIGRSQQAVEQIEIAQRLNSSSTSILADKGLILYFAGRTDEAIALLKQVEETEPSFLSSHRYLAQIDLVTGNYVEYLKESKQVAVLSQNEVELAIAYAAASGYRNGGVAGMLKAKLSEEQKRYVNGQLPAYRVAETYSLLGQKEQAIEFLRRSCDRRESALGGVLTDPAMKNLRDDPSYQQLMAQLGLS